jgi:hypothetical protein
MIPKRTKNKINIILKLGTFNKFLIGAKITKINPTVLLIKNRG